MKYLLFSACLFCFNVLHLYGSDIDAKIDSICRMKGVIGMRAFAIKDTSVIYEYTFGEALHYKNGEYLYTDFNDDRDLWKIASVTKNVVALAIMQLYENWKIDLDADINKYLPFKIRNPKYINNPITVRMLLSHYSSIAKGQYDSKNYKGVEFLDCMPGSKYEYSNINYLLLASIIENMTGERFDRYIQNNIFTPIGVSASFDPYENNSDDLIYGMWLNGKTGQLVFCDTYQAYDKERIANYVLANTTNELNPAGGLIITPKGLIKYIGLCMGSIKDSCIIKERTLRQMRIPYSPDKKCGLGTLDYSYTIAGETLFGHTGYSYGIFSAMIYNPVKKYGFIILCNGAQGDYSMAYPELHAPVIKILYNSVIANIYVAGDKN